MKAAATMALQKVVFGPEVDLLLLSMRDQEGSMRQLPGNARSSQISRSCLLEAAAGSASAELSRKPSALPPQYWSTWKERSPPKSVQGLGLRCVNPNP